MIAGKKLDSQVSTWFKVIIEMKFGILWFIGKKNGT